MRRQQMLGRDSRNNAPDLQTGGARGEPRMHIRVGPLAWQAVVRHYYISQLPTNCGFSPSASPAKNSSTDSPRLYTEASIPAKNLIDGEM